MNLSNPFKRKPKQLDGDDTVDVEDFGTNDEVRKKQMMLMGGVGAVALVLGSMYIFDDGEDDPAKVDENGQEIQIATDFSWFCMPCIWASDAACHSRCDMFRLTMSSVAIWIS